MNVQMILESCRQGYQRWFHKRNIIIVSEHKVKHIPISASTQFFALLFAVSSLCWASYSTGSFMAARSTLKQQGQTLRSVANARIESNFSAVYKSSPFLQDVASPSSPTVASLSDPMFTLAALDHDKLFARIAMLEHKVVELKNTNAEIIQRVHEKTAARINDLQSIIRQTGLSPQALKDQAEELRNGRKKQGGPFIPSDTVALSARESELFDNLDQLALLGKIVNDLPIGLPIKNAEEQSPFGHRADPFTGHLAFHSGLDLAGPAGSKIYSPADGKVTAAGRNGAYGNAIDIAHVYGISTRYGHLSQILVTPGQMVHRGQLIGIQGSTGRSTGAHLHYEVRLNDQPVNPKNFLNAGRYVSQE